MTDVQDPKAVVVLTPIKILVYDLLSSSAKYVIFDSHLSFLILPPLYLGTHCDDRYMQAFVLYPLDTYTILPLTKKNKQIIKVKTYTHLWADGKRGTYFLCGMTLGIFCGDRSWHAERFLHVPFKIIVVTLAQT